MPGAGSIPDGGTGNKGCLTPDPGNPGKLEEPNEKRSIENVSKIIIHSDLVHLEIYEIIE